MTSPSSLSSLRWFHRAGLLLVLALFAAGCELDNIYVEDEAQPAATQANNSNAGDAAAPAIAQPDPEPASTPSPEPQPEPEPAADTAPEPAPTQPEPEPDPDPTPPPTQTAPSGGPIFQWNGRNEFRISPNVPWIRFWWVTHTRPDGTKYDWRSGQYHRVMSSIRQPVPSDGIVRLSEAEAAAIAREGIVQVCGDTPGTRARNESMCWLIRPGVPATSYITESEWRGGKTDGVVLPYGRDG